MACPRCGDHCLCTSVSDSAFVRLSVSDVIPSTRETKIGFIAGSSRVNSQSATAVAEPSPDQWRDEVASRVQAHRAKRKRRYDPDASLDLGFGELPQAESAEIAAAVMNTDAIVGEPHLAEPVYAPLDEEIMPADTAPDWEASHTFDVMAEENAEPAYVPPPPPPPNIYERMAAKAAEARRTPVDRDAENNIIEFPKPAAPQSLFTEELAEPITPRILDVPEEPHLSVTEVESRHMAIPAPCASVTLDTPAELPEWARDYEDEVYQDLIPIQVAPIGPRLMCGIMDAVLVLTAAALFSLIVLSVAKFVPQGKAATAIAVLLPAFFWAVYHYIFLVFGGITPGMLMAQLELSSFEGCVPMRRTRGVRAVAMVLSAMSMGLGFAWAVLDEDSLGWHDRITRTYLRQS